MSPTQTWRICDTTVRAWEIESHLTVRQQVVRFGREAADFFFTDFRFSQKKRVFRYLFCAELCKNCYLSSFTSIGQSKIFNLPPTLPGQSSDFNLPAIGRSTNFNLPAIGRSTSLNLPAIGRSTSSIYLPSDGQRVSIYLRRTVDKCQFTCHKFQFRRVSELHC